MCLLVGQGTVVAALLCTSNFLRGRHCAIPVSCRTLSFPNFAMNVDDIDTYSPSAIVNFQRSDGSIVSAKILGPLERGADFWSITYERSSTVVTHDCALVAQMSPVWTPMTHLMYHR